MKKIFILLLNLFAISFISTAQNIITVPDYRKSKEPEMNIEQFKNKDVSVFRGIAPTLGYAYVATIFRKDNEELKSYRGYIISNKSYQKASYIWVNDSTVSFTLINRKNKKNLIFNLSGYESTTSLEVND